MTTKSTPIFQDLQNIWQYSGLTIEDTIFPTSIGGKQISALTLAENILRSAMKKGHCIQETLINNKDLNSYIAACINSKTHYAGTMPQLEDSTVRAYALSSLPTVYFIAELILGSINYWKKNELTHTTYLVLHAIYNDAILVLEYAVLDFIKRRYISPHFTTRYPDTSGVINILAVPFVRDLVDHKTTYTDIINRLSLVEKYKPYIELLETYINREKEDISHYKSRSWKDEINFNTITEYLNECFKLTITKESYTYGKKPFDYEISNWDEFIEYYQFVVSFLSAVFTLKGRKQELLTQIKTDIGLYLFDKNNPQRHIDSTTMRFA